MSRRKKTLQLRITEIRYERAPDAEQREERVFRILLGLILQDESRIREGSTGKLGVMKWSRK